MENEQTNTQIKEVRIDQIVVNPYQPRRHFAVEELEELATSIQMVGLIHPPVVRPKEDNQTFELISGERRFRAAQLAGLKKIHVLIRASSNYASAQAALIENIQRVDLNPIEIAKALKSLVEEFNLQQEELATRIGKKRSTVANYLRLLNLPKNIQDSVMQGVTSMGHAKAILSVEGFDKQTLLHELVLRDNLTVRETEEAALKISKKLKKPLPKRDSPRDFHLDEIADIMQKKMGTKVMIYSKGKKGQICIDYYSFDDLDRILSLIGLDIHE